MSVYVSFIQDRHTDPEIFVFSDRQKALDHTRRYFTEVVAHPERIAEQPCEPYLLFLEYTLESDYAFCIECPIL